MLALGKPSLIAFPWMACPPSSLRSGVPPSPLFLFCLLNRRNVGRFQYLHTETPPTVKSQLW